ncbi:MAG: ATP-binding protein [Acidobacteriota bacterium]
MRLRWDPSVRTRHLAVIVALALTAVGALTCFNLTRLLGVRLAARHRAQEALADALYQITQQVILENPGKDARLLLRDNPAVRALLEASTGPDQEFSHSVLLSADGSLIAEANAKPSSAQTRVRSSAADLERALWPKQLLLLGFTNREYEIRSALKLSNRPFADIVTTIATVDLRRDLKIPALLSAVFALTIAGLVLLIALLSSPLVLRPLREMVSSIEELEAQSRAGTESDTGATATEPHSITQRLRVLGRRFAGNRSELEMTRDQLRQVIGSFSERVVLLDREQRILLASPEAERLLSGDHGLMRGVPLSDALGPNHPVVRLLTRAYRIRESIQEVTALSANGSEPQTVAAAVQIFADRGSTAGALLSLRDPATLEHLENQLDFATKLAALNRIAAGVAHEVKNPLHAMVLHLELLNAKLASGGDPTTHVDVLVSEVNRLNRVVQTFLDFNRPVQLRPQLVDVTMIVREVLLLAADASEKGVGFAENYATEPLPVKVDADLIKQALLNIVINGCQAMPEGGTLTIETARTPDGKVEIVIQDEGQGIPPEVREKVFNLYFTTKPQGSGIGLSQAFRAAQLHDGRIEVESERGKGARFRIVLPPA